MPLLCWIYYIYSLGLRLCLCLCLYLSQGANASALEKEIGPEQFPVNEHYFGLVNVRKHKFTISPCPCLCLSPSLSLSLSLSLTCPWICLWPCSLETPATVTQSCRRCISAGRSERKFWHIRWVTDQTWSELVQVFQVWMSGFRPLKPIWSPFAKSTVLKDRGLGIMLMITFRFEFRDG